MAISARPAARLSRNPLWLAAGASPLLVSLAAIVTALVVQHPGPLALAPHGLIFGALGFALMWARNKNPRRIEGEVAVDAARLRLPGGSELARSAIRSAGWRTDRERGPMVQIARRRRPDVELIMPTAEAARDLVHELGFDPRQRTATFSGLSRAFEASPMKRMAVTLGAILGPIVGGILLSGLIGKPALAVGVLAFIVSVFSMVAWQATPSKVDVGTDGILIRWFGRSTFVPLGEVEEVTPIDWADLGKTYLGVELWLRGGGHQRILVTQKGFSEASRDVLLERVRDALEVHRSGHQGAEVASLARRGRALGEWVTALRAMGAGADGDLRTAAVPLEALWRLVEDAAADGAARVAAAVALAGVAPAAERERIRIAARSSASPQVRIALERVADQPTDDAAMEEALSGFAVDPDRGGLRETAQ